jgi:hypothetical protein
MHRQGRDYFGIHGAAASTGGLGKVLPHSFRQPNDKN